MLGHGEPGLHLPVPDVWPGGGGKRLQRILVPVDPFGRSDPALALAARFSAAVGGQLRLIHVRMWDPAAKGGGGRFYTQTSEQATAALEQALTRVWATGAPASGVVVDACRAQVARVIAAEAHSWGAEVMVVTRRRRTAIGVLLLGSLPDDLMRQVSCPVLVVRQVTARKPGPPVR
jgi:nucleotide-binding universal stress UspA family protein